MYVYVWFPRGRERARGLAVPAYFTLQSTPIMLNQQNTIQYTSILYILNFKTDFSLTKEALPKQLLFMYIIIIII